MAEQNVQAPKQSSHLKDLILLFAVPVGVVLIAAAVIYLPRIFANPQHDFIYSYCEDYQCRDKYFVDADGHIEQTEEYFYNTFEKSYYPNATLYYYDVSNDSSRSIALSDAQKFTLNTSSRDPDGYILKHEESNGGFLFWSDYSDRWSLGDGPKKKRVLLASDTNYSSKEINFLGWVEDEE